MKLRDLRDYSVSVVAGRQDFVKPHHGSKRKKFVAAKVALPITIMDDGREKAQANVVESRWSILLKGSVPSNLTFDMAELGMAGHDQPTVRRMFEDVCAANGGAAVDASPQTTWLILNFTDGVGDANIWDVCHAITAQARNAGDGSIQFAEPDLRQQWRFDSDVGHVASLTSGSLPKPPQGGLPDGPGLLWYLDEKHANFVGARGTGANARIAHLDTGYDPDHNTLPRGLDQKLQWDFVDHQRDASDRAPGNGLANFGHGTGTIGILAGKGVVEGGPDIGGAPDATVVPVRVANQQVQFYTSTVAAALDYVLRLSTDPETFVDIVTLNMGGLASHAWAEAVNALYDRGVFIVAAAGNNISNWPTRNIVYPARFRRVVAACGVMADGRAYADLPPQTMGGNYGPQQKMDHSSLAAFTPNMPWAKFGCPSVVTRNGTGTSSATPQIAAAAALWVEKYREELKAYKGWRRPEAIRAALFNSARMADKTHFGRGVLDVGAALATKPVDASLLTQEPRDDTAFPLFEALAGVSVERLAAGDRRMLELEALQLSQSFEIERLFTDQEAQGDQSALRRTADIIASSPRASRALRRVLAGSASSGTLYSTPGSEHCQALGRGSESTARPVANKGALINGAPLARVAPPSALEPRISQPPYRPLRVYAFDPTLELELKTLAFNEAVLPVRWEELSPGPIGEYIEVIDVDPRNVACYAPLDLSNPYLLVQNGRRPAEASPQFHQQMVYAVAMKTIEYFERALGRTILWAPHREEGKPDRFVQRLRIYPHALNEANAYYSAPRKALLFGYFLVSEGVSQVQASGTIVFTALSHDVIAHETTHALLDGLHRRYLEPSNPDVLAFHEGFADIVALFQHFTIPEAVRSQIEATGSDLRRVNLLADIAQQFGEATYGRAALRQYVGTTPSRTEYQHATEVHQRGAVLVAAVFDAFLRIFRMRADKIIDLATLGSGVLPPGQIPDVVVERLAQEAAELASQWLNICIRAVDYCPPVDITFGDYLRALITADRDVVPDDKYGYRTALVTAFRDRGVYAEDVRTISPSTLVWEGPELQLASLPQFLKELDFSWDLRAGRRREAFETGRYNCARFAQWLVSTSVTDDELSALGLLRESRHDLMIDGLLGDLHAPEVHAIRPARRVGPDGQIVSDVVIEITQSWYPHAHDFWNPPLRGGVTLLVSLETGHIRYAVRKRVAALTRFVAQRSYAAGLADGTVFADYGSQVCGRREPLAMIHRTSMGYRPKEST